MKNTNCNCSYAILIKLYLLSVLMSREYVFLNSNDKIKYRHRVLLFDNKIDSLSMLNQIFHFNNKLINKFCLEFSTR